jgi:pimeloyl-ACP methyl ester carboxylesterase
MTVTVKLPQAESRSVHANGIDIHYLEAGEGEPLVLLHGGMVSTNPIWAGVPVAYASHMATLSDRFRVIAPDTRGAGKTVHSGGTVTFDILADDVAGLVDALSLDRPLVAGFSDGGITATILGIRHPGAVRAIANHAGYDGFDPKQFATFGTIMRQGFGGSPDATEVDPDAAAGFFSQSAEMQGLFELMKADEDSGQGKDYWKDYLRLTFHRLTHPTGYTVADLGAITVPSLIIVGDRDEV